jgi:hypothetical protein
VLLGSTDRPFLSKKKAETQSSSNSRAESLGPLLAS